MSAISGIVVSTLAAAVGVAVLGWLTCGTPLRGLGKEIGGPSWDFSKSWASNATVVGAILGTVLSAKVLPATTVVVVSANGYTALSLLFGALVVLAPLVFVALPNGKTAASMSGGRGWAYLLAAALTLWGVVGELVTVGLVLYEAHRGKTLPFGAVVPMWCVIGAAILLVGLYGFRTAGLMLKVDDTPDALSATPGIRIEAGRALTVKRAEGPFTIEPDEGLLTFHRPESAPPWALL